MMTLPSQDNFFTQSDYESYTSLPKLSGYIESFINNTYTEKSVSEKSDGSEAAQPMLPSRTSSSINDEQLEASESVILKQVNESFQADTGLKIQYPRLSYLSLEEQRTFLDEYEKVLTGKDLDEDLKLSIKEMKPKIIAEQQEFQHFVYQHVRNDLDVYNVVPEDVKHVFEASSSPQKSDTIKGFPQYYSLHQTIGLSAGAHFRSDPVMEFQEILLQVGDVPLIAEPKEKVKLSLNDCLNNDEQQVIPSMCVVPLSQDPAAVRLAKEHGVHLVTSSSCLQTLFDNQPPQYNQQWDIPVVVMETKGDAAAKDRPSKVVFLEKPFPKKIYTPHEVMQKTYKRALMKKLCTKHNNRKKNFVYSLWKFGKFRLLIRCKLDGYKVDEKTQNRTFLSVAAKPEYQSYFGYERLSISETLKLWLKSFTRPNTTILCARINTTTHDVVHVDELTPPDVLNCGWFPNPGQSMKMMYQIFCNLAQLAGDSYFLAHERDSIHCCLYKQTKRTPSMKKPEIDLCGRHAKPAVILNYSTSDFPWSGIDTELFLPYQIEQRRIPATFPAVTHTTLGQILQKKAEDIYKYQTASNCGKKKKKKKKWKGKMNNQPAMKKEAQVDYHAVAPVDSSLKSTSEEFEDIIKLPRRQKWRLTYRDLDAMETDG